MYLSLNWLKDFVDIPKSITPKQLGLKLTMHTVEIDGIKKQGENLENIVVGEILGIEKHPNADKLKVCKVNIGNECLQIVCGGSNLQEGMLVALAKVGAKARWHGEGDLIELASTTIRGVESYGMICASTEIGLNEMFPLKDEKEILDLTQNNFKPGVDLASALKLDDTIFEVDNKSITNRPDLWGHYGIAREVAAFLGEDKINKITNYKLQITNKIQNPKFKCQINIDVKDEKLCPRYMAIALDGIEIKQSPDWMQKRLSAVGMRPINNIVDITNYVMLELGQPTHTFDLKKISNFQTNSKLKTNIIIRTAKNGEIIKTLDGQERKLNDGMLVIADDKKPIALAGVMGGADTEIDNKTNSILIEAANFDSVSIRKTAQKLGLRSEASMRFEKSLDPNLCEMAMTRIIELVKEFCPQAKIISELQDEKKYFLNQGPIELDLDWVNKKIGVEIGEKKIIEILESLGFKIEQNKNVLSVIIPTWRATKDISIPEDLIEEIIRIYGYDNLDSQMPKITMQAPERNEEHLLERKIKNILSVGAKLTEVYNYSFVGEEQLEKMKINFSSHIKLINPIASHQTMLRQSLIPNLLENIKLNQAKYESINLFEIGNIFFACDGNINKDNVAKDMLPNQEKYLGIIMADKENNLFNKIKGIIKFLTNSLNLSVDFELTKNRFEWMDKNVFAQINILDKNIGIIAQLDDQIAKNLGIKKQVVIAEINIQKLYDLVLDNQDKKYKEIAKYPSVVRDLAFVVENEILYSDIKKDIENFNDLIKQVELFDIYQGEKLGQNKKNLAFHIIYQAIDRTLTSEEVDKVQEELIKYLKKKLRAKIRDF